MIGPAVGGALKGALAQLVARFHGMEEVRGSSPLSSTNAWPSHHYLPFSACDARCLLSD